MEKVLILGSSGMLGHKVYRQLHFQRDIFVTFRSQPSLWLSHPVFTDLDCYHACDDVDVFNLDSIKKVITELRPQVVINCIGIVKQRAEAKFAIPSIQVNALFPHQLADLCEARGTRLIHLSTDCVFSGQRGNYTEDDLPDPVDLYGRTKLLGELDRPGCLTLRTSIIGWELKHRAGLLEWLATQRGQTIKGYRNAIYSGVSTAVLAQLIGNLLENHPALSGIYHVASESITKYDLLVRLRDALGWDDITIEPEDVFQCDRSLNGARFEAAIGWASPTWDEMIAGLAAEWPKYQQWRNEDQ
ncbi:MAG: SDR family oxidoreductase [Anaerolineae bacterium]|nr:SDR family oxidoreductase [Anaerolineae bacterium]